MVLIRHHTKKTRGRPSKPRKPSNILLLAAVRSHCHCRCHPPHHKYNFIPSRPVHHLQRYLRPNVGQGTAPLLLYLSLPSVLVLFPANYACICTCLYHLDLYCAICFCSADPLLSLSVPQSHMAGTNYCNTALPYWRGASICKKPNCKTTRHCFSSQFILMQLFCWNM